ncbi:hypothetical protein Tco_1060325 [Tanacetum coccineum]
MVAYLEKTDGNVEFQSILNILHAAQFTMLSLYITATVAGKPVSISESSIISDLQFNVATGIDGKKISGNMTPLFPSMLAQPTKDEGAVSERPSETQPIPSPTYPSKDQFEPQPDPFLRPSFLNLIPNSIPEGCGGNHGGQSSSDRSQSGTKDNLTLQSMYDLCVSLCKQVTAQAANIKDLKAQIKQLKKKA